MGIEEWFVDAMKELKITDLIVILIIGLMIGYLVCYKLNIRTTDDQVEYVENFMKHYKQGYLIPEHITGKITIDYVVGLYFRYETISRWLLSQEIEKVCGVRPIKRIKLNTSIDRNFCEELCS